MLSARPEPGSAMNSGIRMSHDEQGKTMPQHSGEQGGILLCAPGGTPPCYSHGGAGRVAWRPVVSNCYDIHYYVNNCEYGNRIVHAKLRDEALKRTKV